MAEKFKIKKGDQVIVVTGRDKGKKGEVLEVLRSESRVRVQGINMVKRHRRATQTDTGGIISMEAPLHISNVAHIDPDSGTATRCLLYTSPSPRDRTRSRMPSSA